MKRARHGLEAIPPERRNHIAAFHGAGAACILLIAYALGAGPGWLVVASYAALAVGMAAAWRCEWLLRRLRDQSVTGQGRYLARVWWWQVVTLSGFVSAACVTAVSILVLGVQNHAWLGPFTMAMAVVLMVCASLECLAAVRIVTDMANARDESG